MFKKQQLTFKQILQSSSSPQLWEIVEWGQREQGLRWGAVGFGGLRLNPTSSPSTHQGGPLPLQPGLISKLGCYSSGPQDTAQWEPRPALGELVLRGQRKL